MKLWFVTDRGTLLNADRVCMLYERAGVDDPEEQGVYAILDYEIKDGVNWVQLRYSSLNDLAKLINEQDDHFVIGDIKELSPIDV